MEQQYIGIDLHKASFHACAVRSDGTRLWEIAPFFQLGGIFNVCTLINAVLDRSSEKRWPEEEMTVSAQVDRAAYSALSALNRLVNSAAFCTSVDRAAGMMAQMPFTLLKSG